MLEYKSADEHVLETCCEDVGGRAGIIFGLLSLLKNSLGCYAKLIQAKMFGSECCCDMLSFIRQV